MVSARHPLHRLTLLAACASLAACSTKYEGEDLGEPVPPVTTMYRLTQPQLHNAVDDLLGVPILTELPADYRLHGYTAVGASELSVAPAEFEQYEAMAWDVARDAAANEAERDALLGCSTTSDGADCVQSWLPGFLGRAWRRPATADEVERLVQLHGEVAALDGLQTAAHAVIVATLLAPDFLFRVEIGEPHPSDATRVVFTPHELASRLAFVLTDAPPDSQLLAVAADGTLADPAVLRSQAERLLFSERGRQTMNGFFAETVELYRLDLVDKDRDLFPSFDDALRNEMAGEVMAVFDDIAFEKQDDFRTLLTTRQTWVGPSLAEHYNLPATGWMDVNGTERRGGLLGRAALLTINAHRTVTSPTHRGRFVRTRLLCQSIPPPPPGAVTSLEAAEGGTMRERLSQHALDPSCSGCHDRMDPIGFGLENYDAVGSYRELDNGLAIDASGDLEGTEFGGAVQLGRAVSEHEDFPGCVALQFYRFGTGQPEAQDDLPAIGGLTNDFVSSDMRFHELVLAFVTSEAFTTARIPAGTDEPVEPSDDPDPDPDPQPEPETCNGVDDDLDGDIDEDLDVDLRRPTWGDLTSAHAGCNVGSTANDGPCHAAIHRYCAASDCSATGIAAVDITGFDTTVSCLDDTLASVVTATFAELASHHGGCTATNHHSPDCNAAIHRWCTANYGGTGFGPVEHGPDAALVVCTPAADAFETSYTTLATFDAACNGSTERFGDRCNAAFHGFCTDRGYATGFGPLENSGDVAYAACLGTP